MNFLGKFTSALEAVGEVIAPLPEDDDQMTTNTLRDANNDSHSIEEPSSLSQPSTLLPSQKTAVSSLDNTYMSYANVLHELESEQGITNSTIEHNEQQPEYTQDVVTHSATIETQHQPQEKANHNLVVHEDKLQKIGKDIVSEDEHDLKNNVDDTLITELEHRNLYLEHKVGELDNTLKNVYDQQRLFEEKICEKEDEINSLMTEVATEKRKSKSAFTEVEQLSTDFRETLQSLTALKMELNDEISVKEQLEKRCEELTDLLANATVPLPPPSQALIASTLSVESLKVLQCLAKQLQHGILEVAVDTISKDDNVTADELTCILQSVVHIHIPLWNKCQGDLEQQTVLVKNLEQQLATSQLDQTTTQAEFDTKVRQLQEEIETHNTAIQNKLTAEITKCQSKIEDLLGVEAAATSNIASLEAQTRRLEDENNSLVTSMKLLQDNGLPSSAVAPVVDEKSVELQQQNHK